MSQYYDYRTVGELSVEVFERMVCSIVDSQIPPQAGQFSIERLTEVSKPNRPEPIDGTVQTIRGIPVNTGFLTCADSPETYKRKLDWKKLDDKERQGILRKVFELFRNLSHRITDRLHQMLQTGSVNMKEAIREACSKSLTGQPLIKHIDIKEATALTRERSQKLL